MESRYQPLSALFGVQRCNYSLSREEAQSGIFIAFLNLISSLTSQEPLSRTDDFLNIILTLELYSRPHLPQTVPGHAGVRPEVLAPDLLYVEYHPLSVAVLVNIQDTDPPAWVDRQLPLLCPDLDPVVDGPGTGLHPALQLGTGPRHCAHQVLFGVYTGMNLAGKVSG